MSVNSFDPTAQSQPVDEALVAELITFAHEFVALLPGDAESAAEQQIADATDMLAVEAERFAVLASHNGWAELTPNLADADIVALIRLFTLGEEQFAGWLAGDKSPVVPLVRELKSRGSFAVDLSRWIKSHSNNKFLPHGSLMDRL